MKTRERSPQNTQGGVTPDFDADTQVDATTAWEMAHAVSDDDESVNSLRTAAARLRTEGLLPGRSEGLEAEASRLEVAAGLAHVAGLREQATAIENRVVAGREGDVESSLEQQATRIIEALTEKFPDHTFELIADTVMCTDPNGIDLGNPNHDYDSARSWNSVMADESDERFIVTIDGVDHDSRTGMTFEAYEAMIAAKKAAGEELPDSKANRLDNGWYTWTLMTGEKAGAGVAPFARVFGVGSVDRVWRYCDNGDRGLRVRPAVKLSV